MNLTQHKTAREFLERAGEWLQRGEAENNLIFGISKYFVNDQGRVKVHPYLLTIEDSGMLLGAAIMTPPRHLIIARMPHPALVALANYEAAREQPFSKNELRSLFALCVYCIAYGTRCAHSLEPDKIDWEENTWPYLLKTEGKALLRAAAR